ncbi:SPOR domain-containing protein [Nisaea nitritireducens]|uniref:SPOR domain-containing protein n=1 Tax=Nisaea nitritireducens TaxID=568392 RepID=UPI00186674CA|nr:SPOR domain-containing protein [Nisaea nitritireducens]
MKRGLLAAMLPILLGGCLPVIPPAISLATTGLSGLALLATGKTTADHVISAAADEDCSMLRVVFGDEPCRAYDGDNTKPLTELVAHYPGDSDDWVDRNSIPVGSVTGTTILTARADRDLDVEGPAASPSTILLAESAVDEDRLEDVPSSIRASLLPLKGVSIAGFAPFDPGHTLEPIELKGIVSKDEQLDLQISSLGSWKETPDVDRVEHKRSMSPAGAAEMTVLPLQRPIHRAAMRPGTAQPADHFVMLGSFRDKRRAEHLKETAPDSVGSVPVIMSVHVRGSLWHRVAVGPFTGKDALHMASALGSVSGKKPWAAKITN